MENKLTDEKKPRRTKEKDAVKEKDVKEKDYEKKPRRTKEKDAVKEKDVKEKDYEKKPRRTKDKDVKEKEKDDEKPRRTKEKDVKEKEKDDEKPRRTKEKDEKQQVEKKLSRTKEKDLKEKDEEKPRRAKEKDVKEKEKEKDEGKKPTRTKEKENEKEKEKKPSRTKDKDVNEKEKENEREKEKEKKRDDDEDVEYPFLDMPYLINHTKNYDSLKVCLKMTRKGVGLFARTPIKKGNTVAYYKVKVISDRSTKYKKVKDGIYTFSIYTKDDEKIKKYFGDICMESLENPRRGAPFFGYLANEPSNGQSCNVSVDTNLKDNYIDRDEVRPGDFFLYKLVALRDIPENEEICWYYGDHYDRDYEISDRTR